MLTYNHEQYVAEAVESVLMQKTNFLVVLVIAEDFSTDQTRIILTDYQKRFPDKIKLILQHKNVGLKQNRFDLFNNLESDYIAVLEGDDFWTDPLKLQKQVDFLENNPDYTISMGKVDILIQKNRSNKKEE